MYHIVQGMFFKIIFVLKSSSVNLFTDFKVSLCIFLIKQSAQHLPHFKHQDNITIIKIFVSSGNFKLYPSGNGQLYSRLRKGILT